MSPSTYLSTKRHPCSAPSSMRGPLCVACVRLVRVRKGHHAMPMQASQHTRSTDTSINKPPIPLPPSLSYRSFPTRTSPCRTSTSTSPSTLPSTATTGGSAARASAVKIAPCRTPVLCTRSCRLNFSGTVAVSRYGAASAVWCVCGCEQRDSWDTPVVDRSVGRRSIHTDQNDQSIVQQQSYPHPHPLRT